MNQLGLEVLVLIQQVQLLLTSVRLIELCQNAIK